ncbi:hypothetical protein MANES_12G027401v8 [Manihot esculenta]|uniref:Uncharacterized protein n=1 Tax=Manihot esculenta TaxID=3983 RepID=A0ACB7GN65_MANES|nr:hypothetical protein MANES_12G027401v8 [Manihot esculenta]
MDCFCEKTWSHTLLATANSALIRSNGLQRQALLLPCISTPDFLNMFFEKIYKPLPQVLAMLWRRHPENVEVEQVRVAHYCAAVSIMILYLLIQFLWLILCLVAVGFVLQLIYIKRKLCIYRAQNHGKEANMEREDIKMVVKKWWDIHNDESLADLKAENSVPAEEETFSRLKTQ